MQTAVLFKAIKCDFDVRAYCYWGRVYGHSFELHLSYSPRSKNNAPQCLNLVLNDPLRRDKTQLAHLLQLHSRLNLFLTHSKTVHCITTTLYVTSFAKSRRGNHLLINL
ncbi:hypothetical protein TRVL_08984 [Trypanosoma vivax]|nr:hypothetical protein TRVL_08984 [Trypanosoma vivax]